MCVIIGFTKTFLQSYQGKLNAGADWQLLSAWKNSRYCTRGINMI